MTEFPPLTQAQQVLVDQLAARLCLLIIQETETLVQTISRNSADSATHINSLVGLFSNAVATKALTTDRED